MEDLTSLGETLQQASAALVGDDLEDTKSGPEPVLQLVVIGAAVRREKISYICLDLCLVARERVVCVGIQGFDVHQGPTVC